MNAQKKYRIIMVAGMLALAASCAIALTMGQFHIAFADVMQELFFGGTGARNIHTVLFQVRIPRIILSCLAGAGLAASGVAFQGVFANPMASSDTLGTANGASFGAALAILLGLDSFGVQLMALACGMLAIALVFLSSSGMDHRGRKDMVMVILAGMVISSLFSAFVSLVKYVADPQDQLPAITFWLMGSFSTATRNGVALGAPLMVAGMIVLHMIRYRLNALSLSEDEAKSLGVNLPLTRWLAIGSASAITASVVSMCGVIGWVGLLVPHIARMLTGNDARRLMPVSMVFGALFMVATDTMARCMIASEIPVSILTAVIGAPLFIVLLRRTGGMQV